MILDEIVASKRRAHEGRAPVGLGELERAIESLPPAKSLAAALRDPGKRAPRVLAEFKRKSPSAGAIRPDADPAEIGAAYERAGAAAMSVLTDREFFDGAPAHLRQAREGCALPLLRKDFLLDARDVLEARLLGADAVLLIVRLLPLPELRALLAAARSAGLEALVEAHTNVELALALEAGAHLIGVNHRDLDTLVIDLELSARARQLCGPEPVLVAESGIKTRADVERMRAHGADAILVGEHLMKAPSPGAALAELLG